MKLKPNTKWVDELTFSSHDKYLINQALIDVHESKRSVKLGQKMKDALKQQRVKIITERMKNTTSPEDIEFTENRTMIDSHVECLTKVNDDMYQIYVKCQYKLIKHVFDAITSSNKLIDEINSIAKVVSMKDGVYIDSLINVSSANNFHRRNKSLKSLRNMIRTLASSVVVENNEYFHSRIIDLNNFIMSTDLKPFIEGIKEPTQKEANRGLFNQARWHVFRTSEFLSKTEFLFNVNYFNGSVIYSSYVILAIEVHDDVLLYDRQKNSTYLD